MADYRDLSKRTWTATIIFSIFLSFELIFYFIPSVRPWYGIIAVLIVLTCTYEVISFSAKGNEAKRNYLILTNVLPTILAFMHLIVVGDDIRLFIQYIYLSFFIALLCVIASGRRVIESAQLLSAEIFVTAFLIGSGGTALVFLASQRDHLQLYWLILIVVANDIGAYFFGKRYGQEKIAPIISPGKTVAGAIGGVVSGAIAGFLSFPFALISGWSGAIFTAVYIGVCSQIGDLSKSYLKRLYGVKDTGSLLPGHGGLLDRLDGILAGSVGFLLIRSLLS